MNIVKECPACHSMKIDNKRVRFYRVLYAPALFLHEQFLKFRTFFGYKCKECGYYINEDQSSKLTLEPFRPRT